MKSVLFVSYSMGIGGVEKALLGVVNKFVKEGWDVHIALIKPEGVFMDYLPKDVKIHGIDIFKQIEPMIHNSMRSVIKDSLKDKKYWRAIAIGACLVDSRINGGARMLYDYAFRSVPSFSDYEYDLAVAFAGPDSFIDTYVDKCVKAKEKWGWIHFDISIFGVDSSIIRKVYKNYTRINIVSEKAKQIFDSRFPKFSARTCYTPNIIDIETILKLSEEDVDFSCEKDRKILLTVGRISHEKGQFRALQALQLLVGQGMDNIEWWFVGDGNDKKRCMDFVKSAGLENHVRFLGAKANPYPYMKQCDLYVQPSLHEGFCITLAEAKIFGVPIVATDFTGAHEQLDDYSSASLVVDHTGEDIAEAVKRMFMPACLNS